MQDTPEANISPEKLKSKRRKWPYGVLALALILSVLAGGILYQYSVPYATKLPFRTMMVVGPLCSTNSSSVSNASNNSGLSMPPADYDEQMVLGFRQNLTSLKYNITAEAQNDSYGYGPSYLINGLTEEGYWYQAGISWDLTYYESEGFSPGFFFAYEVWGPKGNSIFPANEYTSGSESFSGRIVNGDIVLVSMTFDNGTVSMAAYDWNTSAQATISYGAFGASNFVGTLSGFLLPQGYFTGLMSEWYHVDPYFCGAGEVTYSNFLKPIGAAWNCVDEWNFTEGITNQSPQVFRGCGDTSFYYKPNSDSGRAFQYEGTTQYSDDYEFVTM